MEAYRPTLDEVCMKYEECTEECPAYEFCHDKGGIDMWLCKYDLSKECEGKYRDCVDCILNKIRAEIIELPTISLNANDIYKADVLQILDKYKAESEGEE